MPIYDYLCTACDHRADILHGINDPGPRFCPSCGGEGTMRKQFAAPAIHFKGTGWAKKDRGASGATRAARAAASAKEPSSSDSGSSGSGAGSDASTGSSSTGDAPSSSSPSSDAKPSSAD